MANAINAHMSTFFQSTSEKNPFLDYVSVCWFKGASSKLMDLLLFFLYIYTLVTGFLPNSGRYDP